MTLVAGLAALGLLVLVLVGRSGPAAAYTVDSTAPDGFAALAELLERRGAEVRTRPAAAAARDRGRPGAVVVVPVPELATAEELDRLERAAEAGTVVVLGRPPGDGGVGAVPPPPARLLADQPAIPAPAGRCDIDELRGLEAVDVAFAPPVPTGGAPSCFGDGTRAAVLRSSRGTGAVVTLSAPELLVNARLQPAKELGGAPLDNAAVALRLFGPPPGGAGPGVRVTFVDPVPSPGVVPAGATGVVGLLPTRVRLALAMGAVAFVLYAWHRAVRLGAPVRERRPVEVAGAELVVAVGGLLRRAGSPDRAAGVVRAEARAALRTRLGLSPDTPDAALVDVVATRTGRDRQAVAAVLLDAPVGSAAGLVDLCRSIDELRQEVLHDPVPA